MDPRLFHPDDNPKHRYKAMDRMNGRKNKAAVHYYEWIGWYNLSVPQRLLGHYRLYHLYRSSSPHLEPGMSLVRGYILQCRGTHRLKYFLNRCFAILNFFVTLGGTDRSVEVHGINRILLYDRPYILEEFLAGAEYDFDQAFGNAMTQIRDPVFLNPAIPINNTLVQINNDQRQNTVNNEYHVHPIFREQLPAAIGAKGKEKGVFSKKQILILFDLLAQTGKIERIDLKNAKRFEAIASLLHALTGKVKESWIAELKDYQYKALYESYSVGELDDLIRTLTNLSDIFARAGFRSVADLADKKIRELNAQRRLL